MNEKQRKKVNENIEKLRTICDKNKWEHGEIWFNHKLFWKCSLIDLSDLWSKIVIRKLNWYPIRVDKEMFVKYAIPLDPWKLEDLYPDLYDKFML